MSFLKKVFGKFFIGYASFWKRFGVEIVPDHFYYPVPNIKKLPNGFFEKQYSCIGIDWRIADQLNQINTLKEYIYELPVDFGLKMISALDCSIYYALIRYYKPKKIVEVGCGETTRIAAKACLKNGRQHPCKLVGIEPYPSPEISKGFAGFSRLIQKEVQHVELKEFTDCDILFIDSSHVVKAGSDVVTEILEILPRLKKGTLVHFHDIFMPKEYIRWFPDHRLFFTEQYLLQAFLMYNNSFRVFWASNYMMINQKKRLEILFEKHMQQDYPVSSFWIQRVV